MKKLVLKKTLTPLHKLPQGHQTGRPEIIMRDQRHRRKEQRAKNELKNWSQW
jgi:hypothetical protein